MDDRIRKRLDDDIADRTMLNDPSQGSMSPLEILLCSLGCCLFTRHTLRTGPIKAIIMRLSALDSSWLLPRGGLQTHDSDKLLISHLLENSQSASFKAANHDGSAAC